MPRPLVAGGAPARRTPTRRTPALAAWILGGLTALAAPAARAQPLTFDALTAVDASGVRLVDNCYEEGGFRVTLVGLACGEAGAFGAWTPDNPDYYTGSPALHNNLGPSVDFAAVGGQRFAFRSIDLATFLGQIGNPTTVLFTGFLAGGGTVTRSVEVPGGEFGASPAALTSYAFSGFGNLRALRLTVTDPPVVDPLVQFDNVALAPVPEPGTVALCGAGLAALGLLARRRRGPRNA